MHPCSATRSAAAGAYACKLLLAAGIALVAIMCPSNDAGAAPFKVRVLDNGDQEDQYGYWSSIATTPDGRVKVAHSMNLNRLRISSAPGGGGQTQGASNPRRKSLQLTSSGEPYLAYEAILAGDGGRFVRVYDDLFSSPVFVSPREAASPALRLDDDDKAHVVFYQRNAADTGWDVYWATDLFGPWNLDWITLGVGLNNNSNDPQIALALSPSGVPRVVYQDGNSIMYARYGFPWETELVVTGVTARNLSLDIDASDVPHVSYENDGSLRYATKSGSSWSYSLVDEVNGPSSLNSSLALDSQGQPHISYWDSAAGDLRYAHRVGSLWVNEAVDVGENETVGQFNSIAIDAYDNIHIAYKQYTNYHFISHDLRYAWVMDCNENGIHDADDIDSGELLDCNGNGQPDECEIALGFAEDCDGNGIPDECDPDCNNNGEPDACEAISDCNANGVPDECEDDCNGNGIPDECEIDAGDAEDCNRNDIPDSCDLASGTSQDCNGNGIPDECDITYGGLPDCDKNGVPDECDFASGDPVDCNGNLEIDLCELPDAWQTGGQEYGWFGAAVASGDFDGDGFTDIAVGQPTWSGARGRVHIYYGGDPMDTVADEEMSWPNSGNQYGKSLATGNINGDAYDDLVIGIPGYSDAIGVVIVYFGTPEADLTYEDSWAGFQANSNFGASVALADVTGDGLEDVIVGAPSQVTNQDPGHVYVYSATSLGGAPIETWDGYANDDDYGSSVANAGDVDGNGRDDVITGTSFSGTNSGLVGYARLFLSQPGGMVEGPALGTGEAGDLYGYAVNSAGDLNDDGFDDFVVTAPYSGVSGDRPGRAFLYFGGEAPDGTPDLVFVGAEHLADLGSAVAPAGDVNADGFADLIIGSDHLHNGGAYSWADLHFGGPHLDAEPDQRIFSDYRGFGMGYSLSAAGDTNGDGIQEVVIGHPQHSDAEFFEGRISVVQLDLPDFGDCNLNGTLDMCDIAGGTSSDDDEDGVPDECSATSVDLPGQDRSELALSAYPTPAPGQVRLTFQLPETGDVRLEVFDASGRRVASLADGPYAAGRHNLVWDRKAAGRLLATGMYQLRLSTSGGERTRRLVLLR